MSDQSVEPLIGPYVGPRPIPAGEQLFGRDKEKVDLSNLLRARRVILLHSPSGAGKTSLIQAGLIPALKREGFQVLPVIRVSHLPPPELTFAPEGFNSYLFSVLFSLESGSDLLKTKRLPTTELVSLSQSPDGLAQYLKGRAERRFSRRKETPGRTLLIFDQFEEILTVDPVLGKTQDANVAERVMEKRKEFFVRLAPVLSDYKNWFIFAMREDFIAGLEPYLSYFPERLGVRFRLEFLTKGPAMQAVQAPARKYKVEFETPAAQKLVDDLSKVTIQEMGQPKEILGLNVEPVYLQVVCVRLWEAQRKDPHRITMEDYNALGSVENALRDYYDEKIAEVAEKSGKHELYLREWIERQLTTPQRLRNQVIAGSEAEYGLDAKTMMLLSNVYLIRKEERRGISWYELAHDRLVDPILQANAAWRERNRIFLRTPTELGTDLENTGWGVIFPAGEAAEPLIAALKPLLDHRQAQAGRKNPSRYQEFTYERGYRPGENAQDFLQRHGAGFGQFNPDRVPYYLLIVGSPQDIPFTFQYGLDAQYAVGRIHFDKAEDYSNYARSVILCESGQVRLPNRAAIFAPSNPDDVATRTSMEKLAQPLSERLPKARPNWQVDAALADQATKSRLKELLGGQDTPALLLSAAHGLAFPAKNPDQIASTGAIVCQDWPGPSEKLSPDYYFSAQDLDPHARLLGLIAFLWGSYTGGMPQFDEEGFLRDQMSGRKANAPRENAPFAFLSRLPLGLLSHPNGGALAVIGLTWVGYTYAFESIEGSEFPTIFDFTLERLMQGATVGRAMEMINQRTALLSARLLETLQSFLFYKKEVDFEKAKEFVQYLDARNYIVIGDPAARLPVDPAASFKPAEAGWQRPTLQAEAVPYEPGEAVVPVELLETLRIQSTGEPIETTPPVEPGEAFPPATVELEEPRTKVVTRGRAAPEVESRAGERLWYFNGLDASTGQPWLAPQEVETMVQGIYKKPINKDQVHEFRYLVERTAHYSITESFEPRSLSQAGWGVIYAPGTPLQVQEALSPLLALRKDQAGSRFRTFENDAAYRPGDTAWSFLERLGIGRGPVDPSQLPYYLLLVGEPGSMPFQFQAELSRRFAVGRLCFNSPEEYRNYAESVARAEQDLQVTRSRLTLFAPRPEDDPVSAEISDLADQIEKGLSDTIWGNEAQIEAIRGEQATKASMLTVLLDQRPDLFLALGQGLIYPPDHPAQRAAQGSLVCQNWPGPRAWRRELPDEFSFQAQDLDPGSDLCGMLAISLNSFSLGTPSASGLHELFPAFPQQNVSAPFMAGLPQRLLSVGPGRGALGVVGLIDHAWSPVLARLPASRAASDYNPWKILQYVLAELLDGSPIGHSLRPLQQLYALTFVQVASTLEDIQWGKRQDPFELVSLWAARNDLSNLALLGDPAARLNVSRPVKRSSYMTY